MKNYILITGVSTGIGLATSKFLIRKKFDVLGSVRNSQDALTLKEQLGDRFHPLIFDVTKPEQIQKSVRQAASIIGKGRLTSIVNNAGIVINGPLLHIREEEVRLQLDINVLGVLRVIQMFFPLLNRNHSGLAKRRIINIGSVSGLFATPFLGPYCISKFALEALTDSLRRECLIYPHIDVVIMEPGAIQTPIWKKAKEEEVKYLDTDYEPILKHKKKIIQSREKGAIPVEKMAREIYRMITSRNVPTRKVVMKNSIVFNIMRNLIPDRWIDHIIAKSMNRELNRKPS